MNRPAQSPDSGSIAKAAESARQRFQRTAHEHLDMVRCRVGECKCTLSRVTNKLTINSATYTLTAEGTAHLAALMTTDACWFSGTHDDSSTMTTVCNVPLLLVKWASSLELSLSYYETHPARCAIAETYAVHALLHFGELAHTLRHLARGGCITWHNPQEAGKRSKPILLTTDETKQYKTALEAARKKKDKRKEEREVEARYNPSAQDFQSRTETLDKNLNFEPSMATLFGALRPSDEFYQYVRPQEGTVSGCVFFAHSDLHYAQVPDNPVEFVKQLRAERAVPECVKAADTNGCSAITEEVRKLLQGQTYKIIIWHRKVDVGARVVTDDEATACRQGAKKAYQKAFNGPLPSDSEVLHLGDNDSSHVGVSSLLGYHITGTDTKRRTLIQQLQFLQAVVELSKADLLVSERTGLADLLSLVSGVPMCQFTSQRAGPGNERLTAVHMSGSTMGFAVQNADEVVEGSLRSLRHEAQLCQELDTLAPCSAAAAAAPATDMDRRRDRARRIDRSV
jgi:hypothetical protein